MIALSSETIKRIRLMFPEPSWGEVEECLLNECGDTLPLVKPEYEELAERIRFAVLKCSSGDLAELRNWVGQAKRDWRDVLMAAGFAHGVKAHLDWLPG